MLHIDLFSGIGGFALAVDEVFPGTEHIFCEIDKYCQALLKKRFEGSTIYGDIKQLTFDLERSKIVTWENNGIKNTETSPENTGEITTIETKQNGLPTTKPIQKIKESQREASLFPDMAGSVHVAGNPHENSSLLTTKIMTVTNNANDTELAEHIGTLSKEDSQTSINCSVGTAICRKEYTENVHIKKRTIDILTAGVPCQPASQAGKRRGTKDDRWLWGEAFRIIRETKPRFVILENVRGILTLESGLVFKSLLAEMESCGYETRAYIIPAVAVNAPHRRDRVWFVANRRCSHGQRESYCGEVAREIQCEETAAELERPDTNENNAPDSSSEGLEGEMRKKQQRNIGRPATHNRRKQYSWDKNWLEVATKLCGVDDGFPAELDGSELPDGTRTDGLRLSKSRHRVERLKALGNAIVPQVAVEIMRAIKYSGTKGEQNEYGK